MFTYIEKNYIRRFIKIIYNLKKYFPKEKEGTYLEEVQEENKDQKQCKARNI